MSRIANGRPAASISLTKILNPGKKAIWFDLDNSPHVPLFVPVIKHFREVGVELIVTARDHSQTIELLDLAGLDGTYSVVGRHYGKGKFNKIRGLLSRAASLVACVKGSPVAVAVSHGSRSMVLAARLIGIPVITMYDYEFTETRIFNRFSSRVLVPDAIPDDVLDKRGLIAKIRNKYPGIKEELYVRTFTPIPDFLRDLLADHQIACNEDKVIVVFRPPATTANYHSAKSDVLMKELLRRLLGSDRVFTILVPRTDEQAGEIEDLIGDSDGARDNYLILPTAVDGLNLAYSADLVISGGGTMNREAVLLGVPVYSIFAGRQGSLDAAMEAAGSIVFVRDVVDIERIKLEKRTRESMPLLTDRVESFVIDQINSYL